SRSCSAMRACSGPTSSAIRERIHCASAGEAPPVETAIVIGPSRWTAGRMNEHSSGTSATLQKTLRISAAAKTASFTSVSEVAAITSRRPSTSSSSNSRRSSTTGRHSKAAPISGATTVTRAPASRSPRAFSSPTLPPPTTRQSAPSRSRQAMYQVFSGMSERDGGEPGALAIEPYGELEPLGADGDEVGRRPGGGDADLLDGATLEGRERGG